MTYTRFKTEPFFGPDSYQDVLSEIRFIRRMCIESDVSCPSNLSILSLLYRDNASTNMHSDANGFGGVPKRKMEGLVGMRYTGATIKENSGRLTKDKFFSFGMDDRGWRPRAGPGKEKLHIKQEEYSMTILHGYMFHILLHCGWYPLLDFQSIPWMLISCFFLCGECVFDRSRCHRGVPRWHDQ